MPACYPAILKVARFGYDGKGQARVANAAEALHAFHQFKGEPCVLEQMLSLDYEVSVVLARDESGDRAAFPPSKTAHPRHPRRLHRAGAGLRLPAGFGPGVRRTHRRALGFIGTLAVEFFVSRGELVVNEMAPRPHNSGHHTIDACARQPVRAAGARPVRPAAGRAAPAQRLGDGQSAGRAVV
jgi:5-(carboxyamino)imidazole ribonucleotide synthase